MMAALGGASMKSNSCGFSTPSAFSCSTTLARLARRISGGVLGDSCRNADSG